jgi:hypothetical protein
MMIHVRYEDGREDDVDDACLVKTEGVDEDEERAVRWVEYRLPGADVIVHRSVAVQVKRWPQGLGVTLGGFD